MRGFQLETVASVFNSNAMLSGKLTEIRRKQERNIRRYKVYSRAGKSKSALCEEHVNIPGSGCSCELSGCRRVSDGWCSKEESLYGSYWSAAFRGVVNNWSFQKFIRELKRREPRKCQTHKPVGRVSRCAGRHNCHELWKMMLCHVGEHVLSVKKHPYAIAMCKHEGLNIDGKLHLPQQIIWKDKEEI